MLSINMDDVMQALYNCRDYLISITVCPAFNPSIF